MAPLVTKRLINVDDYYKMAATGMLKPDENVELINGEIYTMAPVGSKHSAVVRQISTILTQSYADEIIISSQQPVHIDQWNEPEPDIALLKYRKDYYVTAHPNPSDVLMIAEVSDTTYEFDRNMKLPLYALGGIPVYWIIDLSKNCIEVYEEPLENQYRKRTLFFPGDEISLMDGSYDVAEILLFK